MFRTLTILTVIFGSCVQVQAHHLDHRVQKFLEEFEKDPKAKAAELPPKFDSQGRPVPANSKYFSKEVIKNKDYVTLKDEGRRTFCRDTFPGEPCKPFWKQEFAGIDRLNDVTLFLENQTVEKNLEKLSSLAPLEAETQTKPWSGDYWATARGGIAVRNHDPQFPSFGKFDEIWNYMTTRDQEDLNDPETLKKLSPAEKYDLLMGDSDKTLTMQILTNAHHIWERDGEIESWFGICHGWAPAAFMTKPPTQALKFDLPGLANPLEFSPTDLKALASQLWAEGSFETHSIGGRCNQKNPDRDENGRVQSAECFDINPASWHLAIVHQLGERKKSFVMDATYDYQVWNQPVQSYEFVYFNPETKAQSSDWRQAMVQLTDFKKDIFSKYRSRQAVSIVGVAMTVTYVSESSALFEDLPGQTENRTMSVQYFYDLEVDAQGKIIGGEWYQNAHPDFMWAPATRSGIHSSGEVLLSGSWDASAAPPREWTRASQISARSSQPLSRIVQGLMQRSSKTR